MVIFDGVMKSIIYNIGHSLVSHAEETALYFEGKSLSYAHLSDKIWAIAQQIRELHLPLQSVLAVYATNSAESYASILAIWFTGNIYLPINTKHPANRILNILNETNAKAILSDSELPFQLNETNIVTINTLSSNTQEPTRTIEPGHILYILQTSGSSGTPKQVAISTENLTAYAEGYLNIHGDLCSNDCFLQTYEFTSDAFFSGFVIPLLLGASIALLNEKIMKPMALLKALSQYNVTWVKMTPSLLSLISPFLGHAKWEDLKYAQFGGEQLERQILEKWRKAAPNAIIGNSYGPTETTVTSSIHSICPHDEIAEEKPISIGKPFVHVCYKVIDAKGKICKAFEQGELVIGGRQTMNGYLNRDNTTTFIEIEGERYYKTGDKVWFDENGLFYFVGRIDSQIKYNGYRIEPGEIETAITHIIKCRSKLLLINHQLVAFLETEKIETNSLKEQLKNLLPPHMQPSCFLAIEQFPLNMAGKTDTNALIKIYERK